MEADMAIDNFTEFDRNRYSVFAPPQEQGFRPFGQMSSTPLPEQISAGTRIVPKSETQIGTTAPSRASINIPRPIVTSPTAQGDVPQLPNMVMGNQVGASPFAAPLPQGGTVSQMEGGRPMTEQEIAFQKQVGERIEQRKFQDELKSAGFRPEGGGMTLAGKGYMPSEQEREGAKQFAETKARVGIRALTDSMTRSGMQLDDIRSQVDNALAGKGGLAKASAKDALAVLNKINMSRQSRPQDMAKIEERAINNAKYETDETGKQIPANAAAWAKDRMAELDSFVPEGFPDKGLKDYMDKGEYAQLQRTLRLASNNTRGSAVDTAMKLAESNIQKAKGRANRDYQKKVVSEARKAAQNADDRKLIDDLKGELEGIQKRMKKYEDAKNEKDKAKIMSEEQYAGYQSRSGEILGQMQNMNRPQGEQQELERVTADGRIAIFDANTKQFIRYK
jgi:hypothetical protein